jgi:Nucleotidyltransferase domain
MSRDWDKTLKEWADTIDSTGEKRGRAAKKAIYDAIHSSPKLATKKIAICVAGSYRNNTNIRDGSDIDLTVVLRDVFFYEFPRDRSLTGEMLRVQNNAPLFEAFRSDVGAALREHFPAGSVTERNKAFKVLAAGDRLNADVAVFLAHRRYTGKKKANGKWEFLKGIEMRTRNSPIESIVNWPEQHYAAATAKNGATNRRFKRMVRIFKHLRADMKATGSAEQKSAAGQAGSFFLECLVWNAPNDCFNLEQGGYLEDTRQVLRFLLNATKPDADGKKLVEVSGLKPLFGPAGRTQAQAYAFLKAAEGRIFGAGAPSR